VYVCMCICVHVCVLCARVPVMRGRWRQRRWRRLGQEYMPHPRAVLGELVVVAIAVAVVMAAAAAVAAAELATAAVVQRRRRSSCLPPRAPDSMPHRCVHPGAVLALLVAAAAVKVTESVAAATPAEATVEAWGADAVA
jgi:hypothetical protein